MRSSIKNKAIWLIAYPIIFGNLAQTLIALTDTAFLGRVSSIALGASMMAGIYYYVYSTLAWGFAIGVQIIVARRLGEGRLERIGVIFEHGLVFVLALSTILFLLQHLFTADILEKIIQSPNIYAAAMEYMDYRHYGIIFVCFNFLFRALYVGLSNTKVISFSTALMAGVNIFLDYVLIFGKWGFPEMGTGGAALASVWCGNFSFVLFYYLHDYETPFKNLYFILFPQAGRMVNEIHSKTSVSHHDTKTAFFRDLVYLLRFGRTYGGRSHCYIRHRQKRIHAGHDSRICFRGNCQYPHQPPHRRRKTK